MQTSGIFSFRFVCACGSTRCDRTPRVILTKGSTADVGMVLLVTWVELLNLNIEVRHFHCFFLTERLGIVTIAILSVLVLLVWRNNIVLEPLQWFGLFGNLYMMFGMNLFRLHDVAVGERRCRRSLESDEARIPCPRSQCHSSNS
jgi:hypothetical protein